MIKSNKEPKFNPIEVIHLKEIDLYKPLKLYLENEGYTIRSEVKNADIVGVKNEQMIIVEMKMSFNLKLVYQLLERQRLTDDVYAAVPVTYKSRRSQSFKSMVKLLKRLSVGLIVVYDKKEGLVVEKIFDPKLNRYNRSHVKERSLKYEFENRSGDFNTGGSVGKKIITVYREKAIQVGCLLEAEGTMRLKDIRKRIGDSKVNTILQKNHYGWFLRLDRGMYTLDKNALNEIKKFDQTYEKYRIKT